MLNNTFQQKLSNRNKALELLEKFNLELKFDGSVDGFQVAALLQKLILCIDESKILNDTFEKLLTTESLDFQDEAECAIALNKVISEHIETTLKRNVVPQTPAPSNNSNAFVLSLIGNPTDNINEITEEQASTKIANVACINEFRAKKQSQLH